MKIKKGFIKRKIIEEYVVVPTGKQNADRRVIIRLNETGSDIWDCILKGKTPLEISDFLVGKYEVEQDRAIVSVNDFIEKLKKESLVDDE